MLDTFYRTHDYLLAHLDVPVRRLLMDEINWSDRLIAIKGCRGVGKTTFLLSCAQEFMAKGRERKSMLYVNFNNFYFTQHSLFEFAGEFVADGGKMLLLDQIFKYENWSKELRLCYDTFPKLQIVFSASPVMRLIEENDDIGNIVRMYNLRGFSFREYLNLQAGTNIPVYSLDQILHHHVEIAKDICKNVRPLWYFQDYLQHGYYPFFLEKRNFDETLLKTMNMILEVDILIIKQIDVAYLQKIRRLLHIMMSETPCALNVSRLSDEIDTARATLMNYIKYLKDARLLNLLYVEGKTFPMKPNKVYMQNTNLMHAISTREIDRQAELETFFYNTLHACHKVNASERSARFVIDGTHVITVAQHTSDKPDMRIRAVGDIEIGEGRQIPIWMFGLIY